MERMKLLLGKTAKDVEKASYMSCMWLKRAQETSHKELSRRTLNKFSKQWMRMNTRFATIATNEMFTYFVIFNINICKHLIVSYVDFPNTERKTAKSSD